MDMNKSQWNKIGLKCFNLIQKFTENGAWSSELANMSHCLGEVYTNGKIKIEIQLLTKSAICP